MHRIPNALPGTWLFLKGTPYSRFLLERLALLPQLERAASQIRSQGPSSTKLNGNQPLLKWIQNTTFTWQLQVTRTLRTQKQVPQIFDVLLRNWLNEVFLQWCWEIGDLLSLRNWNFWDTWTRYITDMSSTILKDSDIVSSKVQKSSWLPTLCINIPLLSKFRS